MNHITITTKPNKTSTLNTLIFNKTFEHGDADFETKESTCISLEETATLAIYLSIVLDDSSRGHYEVDLAKTITKFSELTGLQGEEAKSYLIKCIEEEYDDVENDEDLGDKLNEFAYDKEVIVWDKSCEDYHADLVESTSIYYDSEGVIWKDFTIDKIDIKSYFNNKEETNHDNKTERL